MQRETASKYISNKIQYTLTNGNRKIKQGHVPQVWWRICSYFTDSLSKEEVFKLEPE